MPLTIERKNKPANYYTTEVYSVDLTAWYCDIYQYLTKKEYPSGSSLKAHRALQLLASLYFEDKEKDKRK